MFARISTKIIAYFDNLSTYTIFPYIYLNYFLSTFFSKYNDKCEEYFINSYDKKIIPFSVFRQILNNKNIQLENEIIEYLIYRMKKECSNLKTEDNKEKISVFDLNYETLLNLIK